MNSGKDEGGRPHADSGPAPRTPWQLKCLELCIETTGDPPPLMDEIGSQVMVRKPRSDHGRGVGAHLLGDHEIRLNPIKDIREMHHVGSTVEQIR